MASKIDAILSINPNAQFTTKDGVIEWLNGTSEISNADIQAKKVELDTAETNAITEKENLKLSAEETRHQKPQKRHALRVHRIPKRCRQLTRSRQFEGISAFAAFVPI